jgi:hypothetical protein
VSAPQAALWEAAYRDAIGADEPPVVDARYALATRLDAGASAVVWQAFDRKLGRQVAIKLFHGGRAHALAEARAACDVISDHVVRVLDVHDGERPYIVMELIAEHDPKRATQVSGASAAVLRPRDLAEGVRWVRDVARGVHAAHLRDVFHRDLKPQNVLIAPVSRRARIADFGLAASESSFAGTPEYMAPEQASGVRAGDRAALVAVDVWGLGALAYELIAGRPPWAAASPAEAWERAVDGGSPPPLPGVPWRLRRVVEKMMALDPRERYESAAEVGDELDAYLARRPTSLDRARVLRAWLWCRRNPQLSLTAAAAVVLATLTATAYWAVVDLRGRARELATEVRDQEQANAQLSLRVAATRRELSGAEAELHDKTGELAQLQHELADEEGSYRAIIAARDQALHAADTATRQLVEQLDLARNDRHVAELGRTMYESFWSAARHEADKAIEDRRVLQLDRDRLQGERDAAAADRDRLQAQLDHAKAELDRLTAEASASAARILALQRELAGPSVDAGTHD